MRGCGTKVVTALKHAKWTLTVEGGRVSFSPSNGEVAASVQVTLLDSQQ
ncbi:DUF6527 family protein [Ferrimicrobium sp.]